MRLAQMFQPRWTEWHGSCGLALGHSFAGHWEILFRVGKATCLGQGPKCQPAPRQRRQARRSFKRAAKGLMCREALIARSGHVFQTRETDSPLTIGDWLSVRGFGPQADFMATLPGSEIQV